MGNTELQESLERVTAAMDQLSQQFRDNVESLQNRGYDEGQIKRLTEGARAMRDSSTLYLEWARFYAKEMAKLESGGSEALDTYLDEGADFGGMEIR